MGKRDRQMWVSNSNEPETWPQPSGRMLLLGFFTMFVILAIFAGLSIWLNP